VADYAASLLKALARLVPVSVNDRCADVSLYHLGNNQLHGAIYEQALQAPGVAVLHDAVLQHFFLGRLNRQQYIEEFTYNYGGWTAGLADDLYDARARSAVDPRYFAYPMIKRVVERSRAIIVHNPGAAEIVRRHAPEADIEEIPHLFEPPELPPAYEIERTRHALNVRDQTLVCGVFGFLRESKRLHAILRAVKRVAQTADIVLLIAGECGSSDLARGLEPLLAHRAVRRVGYLPEADFWRYGAAVDVCINLRHPAAGETSGIAIRLMGIGKPVILSSGLEAERYPETACLRVETGPGEEEALAEQLIWLHCNRWDGLEIGRRAAAHIGQHHSLDPVAKRYQNTLMRCYHRA
jgi:glycosyltransferase involved in cell wall biosynthesis